MATIYNSDTKRKIYGDGKPFKGVIKHNVLHKMPDGKYYHLMLVSEDGIDRYYTDGQLSGTETNIS